MLVPSAASLRNCPDRIPPGIWRWPPASFLRRPGDAPRRGPEPVFLRAGTKVRCRRRLPQPIPSRRTACAGDNRASRDRIELSSSVETSSSNAVSAIDIRFPVIHSRRISPGCVGCCGCIFMGLPYVPRSSCPSHASTDAEWLLVLRRQSSGLKQEIDRFRQQRLNVAVLRHRKMAPLRRCAEVEVPADVFQAGAVGAGRSCSPGHSRCGDGSWRFSASNLSGRTL